MKRVARMARRPSPTALVGPLHRPGGIGKGPGSDPEIGIGKELLYIP